MFTLSCKAVKRTYSLMQHATYVEETKRRMQIKSQFNNVSYYLIQLVTQTNQLFIYKHFLTQFLWHKLFIKRIKYAWQLFKLCLIKSMFYIDKLLQYSYHHHRHLQDMKSSLIKMLN